MYELFDDKVGLVRAMFFEGFRLLGGGELAEIPQTDDALGDLERLVPVFRLFCRAYPKLAQVMFSRPFADFEPGPDELAAGAAVREVFVSRIQRCIDKGLLGGDPTDIAHVLLALAQGLAVRGRPVVGHVGDGNRAQMEGGCAVCLTASAGPRLIPDMMVE